MNYKIGILALVALQAFTVSALPPCVCTRNLQPVCGSDGNTYANECILDCEVHKGAINLTLVKHAACHAEPCVCSYDYKPVCGNDGATYPNKCTLVCQRSLNPEIEEVYEGACRDAPKNTDGCVCTEELNHVCGTDGNTYPNPCNLHCATAKDPAIGLKHPGRCIDTVRVAQPCICTDNIQEVCGTNGNTYDNACLLNCATAKDSTLGIKHEGKCVNVVNPIQSDQPNLCSCPRNYKPICGSDGVTYDNECQLKCAGPAVRLARMGSCHDRV